MAFKIRLMAADQYKIYKAFNQLFGQNDNIEPNLIFDQMSPLINKKQDICNEFVPRKQIITIIENGIKINKYVSKNDILSLLFCEKNIITCNKCNKIIGICKLLDDIINYLNVKFYINSGPKYTLSCQPDTAIKKLLTSLYLSELICFYCFPVTDELFNFPILEEYLLKFNEYSVYISFVMDLIDYYYQNLNVELDTDKNTKFLVNLFVKQTEKIKLDNKCLLLYAATYKNIDDSNSVFIDIPHDIINKIICLAIE
jgi:hypothetical protein